MSKYGNKATLVDDRVFDSQAEAKRYKELRLLEHAGQIAELTCQPVFELQPAFKGWNGKAYRAITYRADFHYFEVREGGQRVRVVEDVKGFRTKEFQIKEKLFRYRNPDLELRLIEV